MSEKEFIEIKSEIENKVNEYKYCLFGDGFEEGIIEGLCIALEIIEKY